jgi:hypothetical protein
MSTEPVGLLVQDVKESFVGTLRQGAFAKFFVVPEKIERIFEIGIRALMRHGDILAREN